MARRLSSLLSILFFAAMMSLLVRDHIWPMFSGGGAIAVSTAEIADIWAGKDEWMTVEVNGASIGAIRNIVQRTPDGYHAFMKAVLEGPLVGGATISASGLLNTRLELEQIRVTLERPGMERPALELGGLVERNSLLLKLESPSGIRFSEVSLPRPITLNSAADPLMARGKLTAGETYAVDVYDPLWGMRAGRMRFSLKGLETVDTGFERLEATVVEAEMDSITTRVWLDAADEAVRREFRLRAGGGEGDAGQSLVVRLDRLSAPEKHPKFQALRDLPSLPEYQSADLRGENRGSPLQALGLLPMMLQGASAQGAQRYPY